MSQDQEPDLRRVGIHPDFWYPVARSRGLKPGRALGVSFAGEPIVLVRTAQGAIFALEDRCAHRQVPLHAGVVCGETLKCGYHGWSYDKSGKCVNVPYLGRGALPNGVRGYPCREAYGLIFIFPGDPAKEPATVFPDVPAARNPEYKTRYLDRRIRCHYSFMHENLMDMNHQFLHRSLMGGIQPVLLGSRRGEDWIEATYKFDRVSGAGTWGERFMIGKEARAKPVGEHNRMTIRSQYPYQTLSYWPPGADRPALDLWLAYVPVDREQKVTQSFGLMNIRKPRVPGLIYLFWPFIVSFTEGIFDQDRWIMELEQEAHDLQGADLNQEIFPLIRGVKDLLLRRGVSIPDPASLRSPGV